ncbi:MAG: hypothetical protein KAS96_03165 [Planctomycetes bacterium]|nr:hypothetical protein [Planctomycetota bacterium]
MIGCCFYRKESKFSLIQIILVLLFGSIAIGGELDPNLVGWWKFDEGAGDVAYDSSGHGNHCTILVNEGASSDPNYTTINNFTTGVSGTALQLDGVWHTAYIPHDDILKPAKEMTISIWLKTDTLEQSCHIYGKGDGGGYGASVNQISIEGSPGDFDFRFTLNAGGTRQRLDAPITQAQFADDQWHLYTCSYDGNDMKIYKDAVIIAQLNCPGEIGVCDSQNAYLGSLGNYCPTDNPGVVHYNGLMDDLRIYNRALNQQEILEMAGVIDGATNPVPANGEKSVSIDAVLKWSGSGVAASFDIYMGTDAQAVEDADILSDEFMSNQTADINSFDPSGLNTGTIYYWRVDEVNDANVTMGQVWNFETLGDVDPNLIGWWKFDEQSGNTAYDSSGNNNHATIAGNPLNQAGVIDNAVVFFGTDEYAQVANEADFDVTGNITLSAWIKVAEYDTSSMYIISKSDSYNIFKDMDSDVLTFLCNGTGRPVTGTTDIVDGQWHHVAGVYDGVNKYIYVDGQLDGYRASSGAIITNDNPLYIGSDAVWPDNEFNGLIDDTRIYDKALTASDVMALAGVRFSFAYDPDPADGMQFVPINETLSWQAGNYAASHDVYFGTDYLAVKDANTSSAEYMGNQAANSYPATLELNTTYYWRVDEVNDTEIYTGNLWSFTTTDELPDPDLTACWKFSTGYGYTAYDTSGNENHAQIGPNVEWTSTRIGTAIDISWGTENCVKIEDKPAFDITDEITVATWFWKNGWGRWDSGEAIISKGDTAWKLYRNGGWLAPDSVKFHIEGVGDVLTAADTALADAKWHHIACVYDGSVIKIYVDGQLDNSTSASGAIAVNSEPVMIGNDPVSLKDSSGAFFKDTRIYSRALNAAEVDAIATPVYANRPHPTDKAGTVADANVTLSWCTGKGCNSQNLYFSSDYYSAYNSQVGYDAFVAALAVDSNSYSVTDLQKGRYYYWRVDQIDGDKVWKGNVWSFYVPLCDSGDMVEDIDRDCVVNLSDFAVMADSWTEVDANTAMMAVSFQCTSQADDTYIRLSLDGISVGLSVDDDGFTAFETGGDVQWLSVSGEPAIPYKRATVLLPADVDMSTVKAEFVEVVYKRAEGTWQVKPTEPLVARIGDKEIVDWPEGKTIVDGKDIAIYEKNELWPALEVKIIDKGQLRKYKLATVAVPLVRFNPVTGKLVRLAMADIKVTYSTGVQTQSALMSKADKTGRSLVEDITVNFEQMAASYGDSMEASDCGGGPLPGYIIMTNNYVLQNSNELANFVAHKQARGFEVTVVTEDDWGGGSGVTAAENMRAWLIDNWADDGLADYLLIIGNPDLGSDVPMLKLEYSSYDPPADYFFADLTGNWDLDGDGIYGESPQDFGEGGVDRNWELLVGRIPFYGVIADLDYILAKTIDYECQFANQSQWRKSGLLTMAADPDYRYELGEALKYNILDPAGWLSHRIYKQEFGLENIAETIPTSEYTTTDVWSAGKYGFAVWWTHGADTSAAGIINLPLMERMNDRYPSFTFAATCSNAHPENRRNISYSLLLNGGIANVGATRVSWRSGTQFEGSGNNAGMAYEYIERLVEEAMTAGMAFYEMKRTVSFYWGNLTTFNLYGDPSLRLSPPQLGDLNNDG